MQIQAAIPAPADRPVLIAGPCSAETEAQVLDTALALAAQGIDLFRAGIWKPRTRPGSFEGVGEKGLPWLRRVKAEVGLPVTTEVANGGHVQAALEYDIDALWIGARTTVNPFSVQELADALRGVDIPVLVKNPINPDFKLWLGAVERLHKAGVRRISAIHRGFSFHGSSRYRNVPLWELPIELKRQFPDLQIICDISHICGRRDLLQQVAQKAYDLNFDGLMTEVHPHPDNAWSDAAQQITPSAYQQMILSLIRRLPTTDNVEFWEHLDHLRGEIDEVDEKLLLLLSRRMQLSDIIGRYKKLNNISILQTNRWNDILQKMAHRADDEGLSKRFISTIIQAIHQESINRQNRVMNFDTEEE